MQATARKLVIITPRRRVILTDMMVRRMTPPRTGRRETWDMLLSGFGLRCSSSGAKAFVLLTRFRGKPIRLTWKYPHNTLAQARDHARAALQAIERGEDPRDLKRLASLRSSDVFEVVAVEFVEKWSKEFKRTWREDERILTKYVVPKWKDRPITSITRIDVIALRDNVKTENGPIQANRVLSTVKKLFAWSLDEGRLDRHPAAGVKKPSPERSRERALKDAEIKALWRGWEVIGFPSGSAMQILLLTGARRGEVQRMAWDEIDLDAATWTVPADRVKVKLPLIVPLSSMAVDILKGVPRFDGCGFVFTRGRRAIGDWSNTVTTSTELAGVTGWRIHDLRRTMRTGLSKLGVASEIAERAIGHKIGGVIEVYDRHAYLDEKRDALERWAAHVQQVVGDGEA